ncbi:CinA family protein [Octadecabacter sp. G9-8]|uniref:CinA family protein n=1 Tax=Octadecabacter dasysiphoniae TaxID=2909341 RepID=A0ABS9CWF5_9RHOB|nr:CinA family protein [Octadecabacter dasysiphoniae]
MGNAADIVKAAIAKGVIVSTAESCTGGLVGAAFTDVAGSSAMFEYGFITYSNAAKVNLLAVSQATLDAHGAVSEETAREMALGARAASGADIAVSITGIAGPGGSDHKPEGRVCFGLADAFGARAETSEFGALGRDTVRRHSVDHALSLVMSAIVSYSHKT